jgi:KUP system potassium uptake protein
LVISVFLIAIMTISYRARNIKNKLNDFSSLTAIIDKLNDLSADTSVPKFATHLVYMTGASSPKEVETKVAYSLFNKSPKRADTYWFVHVRVVDEPHAKRFKVHTLEAGKIFWIEFELGFRVEQRVNQLFRLAVNDLVKNREVDLKSRYPSLREHGTVGDFKFVVLHKYLSLENDLSFWDQLTMNLHFMLKRISLSEEKAFGLDTSAVTIENVPMIIERSQDQTLERLPA